MSKLTILKRIKIKSINSLRFTIPESFLLNNNIQRGDELIVFMTDTNEMVIRKLDSKIETIKNKR